MAKKRLFLSYDYDNDRHLPGSLIRQAKDPDSPFSIVDVSLKETQPDAKWVSEAQKRIQQCDFFVVLLGRNRQKKEPAISSIVESFSRSNWRRAGENNKRVPRR